jgi:hypothetical protein
MTFDTAVPGVEPGDYVDRLGGLMYAVDVTGGQPKFDWAAEPGDLDEALGRRPGERRAIDRQLAAVGRPADDGEYGKRVARPGDRAGRFECVRGPTRALSTWPALSAELRLA